MGHAHDRVVGHTPQGTLPVVHRSDLESSDDEEFIPKMNATTIPPLTTTPIPVAAAPTPPTTTLIPSISLAIAEYLTHLEEGQARIKGLLHQILAHLQHQNPSSTPVSTLLIVPAPVALESPPSPSTSSVFHHSYTDPEFPWRRPPFWFLFSSLLYFWYSVVHFIF